MEIRKKRNLRINLSMKIAKNKRLTLTERGLFDVIHGTGRVPDERDFRYPKWMKRRN